MPFDRVITLRLFDEGTFQDGIYEPGPATDYTIWAEKEPAQVIEHLERGGIRIVDRITFRIRWRRDILEASPAQTEVIDDVGTRLGVVELREDDPAAGARRATRRRTLTIICEAST